MIRIVLFTLLYLILGLYVVQGFKTITKNPWIVYLYISLSVLVLLNFLYQFVIVEGSSGALTRVKTYAFSFFVILLVFKLVTVIFLFSEDVFRFLFATYSKFFGEDKVFSMPDRRKFISTLALGIAAIPFGALLYGMYKGKYNFKVLKYDLEYDDLPDSFDGYQITQISDVHSGSFDNREKIEYAINLINEQKSDILLFTGDMVNNKAEEMYPWKDLFSTLEAKDGKFSVLGNHDYGDYVQWPSKEAKVENLKELKKIQKEMGFHLLLNDSKYIIKGEDKIALVGVENWGKGGFKKAGDLHKATSKINNKDFKILMSHDPSHWEQKVIKHPYHYHLTLSGHTHGMQFGIEIPGWIKWSPVKWRYTYWAGIYKQAGQFINVNRGFGFLGYPGRVGIWPEITVITLKKKKLT